MCTKFALQHPFTSYANFYKKNQYFGRYHIDSTNLDMFTTTFNQWQDVIAEFIFWAHVHFFMEMPSCFNSFLEEGKFHLLSSGIWFYQRCLQVKCTVYTYTAFVFPECGFHCAVEIATITDFTLLCFIIIQVLNSVMQYLLPAHWLIEILTNYQLGWWTLCGNLHMKMPQN